MRYIIGLLIFTITILGAPSSHGGYWVKKGLFHSTSSSETLNEDSTALRHHKKQLQQERKKELEAYHQKYDKRDGNKHNVAQFKSGWKGIASIACAGSATLWIILIAAGAISYYSVPLITLLSIPAVVFGILGVRRKSRHENLAWAGLILGGIYLLFISLLIFLAWGVWV